MLSQSIKIKNVPEQDPLQVTICTSFVVKLLQDYLIYWSNEFGLNMNVSFAPYNQVFQQLLNPNSLLNQNKGINVLFIRIEDWLRDQTDRPHSEQSHFLNQTYLEFIEAINQARKNTSVPFLISIVPLSSSHSFSPEIAASIVEMNRKLDSSLRELPWFYLLDLAKIATLYDIEEVFDSKSDEVGHIPFSPEYYAALGTFLARRIRAYIGPSYKVIAIDCDNVLWKGDCGKGGIHNVVIDKNYTYLQEFLLEKYNEGFLLVLCATNNEKDVWEIFDHHPQMKIKREHIAAYRINHDSKDENFISIARELNLGLDNFIFLNSSNIETEQLSVSRPEILSLTLPEQPDTFFSFLNHIWEFDTFHATEEDRQRNKMYMAEKERKQEQENFTHIDEFLKSLNIKITLKKLDEADIDRALQLTLRTNQFNLNGIRKTREEISNSIPAQDSLAWIIDVKDRFGDYGIVGLLLAREIENTLAIDTFVMSCRAMGKNVEDFILTELEKYCAINGLDMVIANYLVTPRNQPFLEFLTRTDWKFDNQTNTYNFLLKDKKQSMLIKNEEPSVK
jgi:FkbH-like protein